MKKLLLTLPIFLCINASAQTATKSTPYPDCIITQTLTAVGATSPVPASQNPTACAIWIFAYTTNSIPSGVSIAVQTAPDVSGAPGSWTNATATTGSNPSTATTSAAAIFGSGTAPVAFPWWRINLATLTGGGKITAYLYGWKLSARIGGSGGGGGSGTVTSVSCGNLSPVFTCAVANPTTTPAISFTQISESQNLLFASPNGSSGNPLFRALVDADLPATAVTPGTYGDSTHFPQFTVSQTGRLTFAANLTPLPASAGGNYVQNFTAQTSVTLTHNFGTQSVVTECYDGSNGSGNLIIPANIANTDANDTTVTFSASQSGSCVVNASSNNPSILQIVIPNAGSTGTTAFTLSKFTGAPSTAVIAATTDTGGVVGVTISGAGTTGSATIQTAGLVNCVFSNATTAGDYVQISGTTAGNCLDTGAATYPVSGGQVIGRVLTTHGGAGTYTIDFFAAEVRALSVNIANVTGLGTNVPAFLETPSGANFNAMIAAGGVPISQNSQSTAYTLVLSDGGGSVLHPTADNNARTFTIPANASVAYAVGTVITFINQINTVTIAINSDTLQLAGTATTGSRTLAAGGLATATKVTSTLWFISGPGLT